MRALAHAHIAAICLIFAACPKAEEPPPAEKPATPAVAAPEPPRTSTVTAPSGPITFGPLKEPRSYTLREVMIADLAEKPLGGHKLTVDYSLKAAVPKEGEAAAVSLLVERIDVEAKRDDYKTKLVSTDTGHMHRVKNGADTLVAFESVWPFALLETPLEIGLDARGFAKRIEGGAEVRKKLLAIHPANTGKDPRNQRRVEELVSDRKIVELLLPAAVVMPEDGDVVLGRRIDVDRKEGQFDYLGEVAQATLLRPLPGGMMRVHTKRSETAAEGIEPEDLPKNEPKIRLIKGDADQTVDFASPQPAFEKAAFNEKRALNYTGDVGGQAGDYPMNVELTRIWERR